jgi:DNA-directed RNA polymerase subunit alpha
MDTLPLPKTIKVLEPGQAHAVFAIEPLYPGYGMTVGNAIRRVLLSSLPGAAITNIRIEGVNHEFSTIPYVKEDIVDIILNIKKIRLKMNSDGPATVKINVHGAKTVTAGDIEKNSEVEVISVDQPIATLTDKAAKLEMELTVESGRGYVPVEQRDKPKNPIGTIAIDAVFSPIRNVNFSNENVRVGQMTNFDRLRLEITTDGSVTPMDALHQAAVVLMDHFQFIRDTEIGASGKISEEASADEKPDEVGSEEAPTEKPKKRKSAKPAAEESTE